MNNNSPAIIQNIQELICLFDNDLINYKDVLDQIIVEIIKVPKQSEGLITYINGQLANSQSRKNGLIILNILLPLCPQDILEKNAIAWINNSLKNCQHESNIQNVAYKIIKTLLETCCEIPELNKLISSSIIAKIIEYITKLDYKTDDITDALKCLETCLRSFSGSCIPFKSTIESFLISFVDCKFTNNNTIRSAGKCIHLLQQVGGGGAQGINYKEFWKKQQLILCSTMHLIMDNLFESVMEVDFLQQDNISPLKIPDLPNGELMKLNSNRLINLSIFLQEMLLGSFPTEKHVSPSAILNVISRGLSVTRTTIGSHLINDAINLSSGLYFIHLYLLKLLQALILCLGCNLIPYAAVISKLVINNLKCTKPKHADNVRAFCNLRLVAYETLSFWMSTAKSASCVHTFADALVPIILTDVTPVTTEINLNIQNSNIKHLSKKARKKSQQDQIIQSSMSKNYSPVVKKKEITTNIYQIQITTEAFKFLQNLLLNCGQFLKPIVHKQLQEFIIKLLLNVQKDIPPSPYDNVSCKLCLYQVLTTLVTSHHSNMSPPLNYALYLLGNAQRDTDQEICSYATGALQNLKSFINPCCPSLQIPLNLENLRIELNLDRNNDQMNDNNITDDDDDDDDDNGGSGNESSKNEKNKIQETTVNQNEFKNLNGHGDKETLGNKSTQQCQQNGRNGKEKEVEENEVVIIESTEKSNTCQQLPSNKSSPKKISQNVVRISDSDDDVVAIAPKRAKIIDSRNDVIEITDLEPEEKNNRNDAVEIVDEEDMEPLVLTEPDDSFETDKNNDKNVENQQQQQQEQTGTKDVGDKLTEADMLASFVDIIN